MKKTALIIVNGHPGTGKTTIAKKLSKLLSLPLISKDDIKESLFDTLGVKDREWSKTLGGASIKLLFDIAENHIATHNSIIIENAFIPKYDIKNIQELINKHPHYLPIELYCTCDEALRQKRFIDRNESGNRHPGHVDSWNYNFSNKDTDRSLKLNEHVITLDTTDFDKININDIAQNIQTLLN
ncbi:ATP-binding protein [Patescibacteria group bacterium]|nr:ATP-binding protein [Patescibacteria group bacterium]MBU1721737.1 ATP-binding protein [Patescibacteria group bacterium]MBU1901424.1 ATP-binding protein [Patescibacteria group bacterium]